MRSILVKQPRIKGGTLGECHSPTFRVLRSLLNKGVNTLLLVTAGALTALSTSMPLKARTESLHTIAAIQTIPGHHCSHRNTSSIGAYNQHPRRLEGAADAVNLGVPDPFDQLDIHDVLSQGSPFAMQHAFFQGPESPRCEFIELDHIT